MRHKKSSEKGSMTVWMVLGFPIMVIFLCLLVNVILLVDANIRMQSAVDRGVYAGASYLAHVMNEVAERNLEFRRQYLTKESVFKNSEENYDVIKKDIDELNINQGMLHEEMMGLLNAGYSNAHRIAKNVTEENLENMPHLLLSPNSYVPLYGEAGTPMFDMVNECDGGGEENCINKEKLVPVEIVYGADGSAYDPREYKSHPFIAHKYLIKDGDYFVAISGGVITRFVPPLLRGLLGSATLDAVAAAQPYGGSIKHYALSIGDGVNNNPNDEFLYHPEFIPVNAVVEAPGVYH